MQFWPVTVIPKYLNFTIFSKNLLSVSKLWTYPEFRWWDITMFLVFCLHTSTPTFLTSNRASVFFCTVFIGPLKQYVPVYNSWQRHTSRHCSTLVAVASFTSTYMTRWKIHFNAHDSFKRCVSVNSQSGADLFRKIMHRSALCCCFNTSA
jgi:hypothetical protein